MYPSKTEAGSYWITRLAKRAMQAAARRTSKSESDVIEHCLRVAAPGLTAAQARRLAEANRELKDAARDARAARG